jgi:protoporphyrinogen oxidase
MLGLVEELELTGELFFHEARSGFYGDGRLVSMAGIIDFLRFPFLTLWQKFRLGMGILLSTRVGDATKLDRIYVREWLTRMFGRRVYEQIWDPLLRSKLGAARERTSAAFIRATIKRLYGARQGSAKVERMGHVRGGYSRILDALSTALARAGVELRLGERVERVAASSVPAPVTLTTSAGEETFDHAVLTVPSPEILRVIEPGEADEYWKHLGEVTYLGVVCVFLVLSRPLSPYYVINLLDASLPFTGIIEATNVVDPAEVGGKHLLYLPKYAVQNDPIWNRTDADVSREFTDALERVFGDLDDEHILHAAVFRRRHVQPLQDVDYLRRLVGYRTPMDAVSVVNTSMIYNSTLNNNAVVQLARDAAATVAVEVADAPRAAHQTVKADYQ